jgi:hypothetical protein
MKQVGKIYEDEDEDKDKDKDEELDESSKLHHDVSVKMTPLRTTSSLSTITQNP